MSEPLKPLSSLIAEWREVGPLAEICADDLEAWAKAWDERIKTYAYGNFNVDLLRQQLLGVEQKK